MTAPAADTNKIRVLSVDDHAFLAEGLRARLALEADMEVVGHLPSADGLVDRVRQTAARIVLLDIEMPGRDPFEALAELRRLVPDCRVIILSAYVRDRYVDATVKAGAWGYLAKSDDPETIIRAVRDVHAGRFVFGPMVMERCRQLGRAPSGGSAGGAGGGELDVGTGQGGPDTGAAIAAGPGEAPSSRLASLTPRELQVLRLIGKGLSRTEIAKVIFRSPKTVDAHRSAIMEKLAIRDRVELARYAIREGLAEL